MTKPMIARRMMAPRSRAFDAAFAATENMNAATPRRWSCHHHTNGSDIEAYVPAKNGLEIIAETRKIDGVDARANAELIAQAVNNHGKLWPLIVQLMEALELCFVCNLSWAAETEADIALRRAREVVGRKH